MEGREGDLYVGPQGDQGSRPDITELGTYPPPDDHKSTKGSCPCCSCGSSSKQTTNNKDVEFGELGGMAGAAMEMGEVLTTEGKRTRKWKYFQGNNHFYCDGRIMTAPSIRYFSLSLALILLTFGLFIAFDAPFLTKRLTVAVPIVSSILFVLVISNMLRTSCSDPGIIPRASLAEVEYMERSYGNSAATYRPPPRTKDIVVNGQVIKSKYCFTCKMFRPPRASHCSICDNCVERFDHHCPFLGNCVGRRNYRSFYFFGVSLSLLAILILSCSITHLVLLAKEHGDFLVALRDSPTSAVVILISFFGMWTVIGLAGFHTYLIAVEQTTNEDIKGIFGRPNSKNPYSRGSTCRNCCYILCGPYPSSLLDPRGIATHEFLSSIQRPKTVEGAVQQQPARAPVPNSASFGVSQQQYPVNPAPNGVDIHHLTMRNQEQQQQQGVPLRQIISAPTQPQLRPNGILPHHQQESLKAGTFPDSPRNGHEYFNNARLPMSNNKKVNGNGNVHPTSSSQLNPSINTFHNDLSPDNQLTRESLSMVQLHHPKKTQLPTSQRRNNRDDGGGSTVSSSLRTSSSAASLERLTMINSPLHLDPVM